MRRLTIDDLKQRIKECRAALRLLDRRVLAADNLDFGVRHLSYRAYARIAGRIDENIATMQNRLRRLRRRAQH